MSLSRSVDHIQVLIVGAGPAGLAAAHRCLAEGISFAVVESGGSLEDREDIDKDDLASGVGGAGLYSDGKLSFYPSAHALWALPATRRLQDAYGWLQSLVTDLVGSFPPAPIDSRSAGSKFFEPTAEQFKRKDYASLVLNLEARRELLRRLLAPIQHRLRTRTRVVNVERSANEFDVILETADGNESVVHASRVIFCLGRFSTSNLPQLSNQLQLIFRRFEYGVRIEQPAQRFFLRDDTAIDTKLLLKSNEDQIEWRTFCCCRDGVVLRTKVGSLQTYSGTSCANSGLSNVGFNCRILSPSLLTKAHDEVAAVLAGSVSPFSVPFDQYCSNGRSERIYGAVLDGYLQEGLNALAAEFDLKDAVLHGPCVEGIGSYPKLSSGLETSIQGLFVAGDGTGLFRGLLASFISGFYAAAQASHSIKSDVAKLVTSAQINVSESARLSLVFTAQSKQVFYCRDAICEYVFTRGHLPINPFRVFGYFLDDRVDRDIIRRGNNQLVRTCDELWIFGPIADGVLFELFYAAHIGKPVRFFTVGTRASDIRPIEHIEEIKFEPEVHATQQTRKQLLAEIERMLDVRASPRQRTLFDLE